MSDLDVARPRAQERSSRLTKIVRKKPRERFRGTPPPATFDIDALPDSTRLTETETAAVIRRPKATLEAWRKRPEHPLKWGRAGVRILYELASIRAFLRGE